MASRGNTQEFTILAQDPAVLGDKGELLLAAISVPQERLAQGPTGHRLKVVDFDASTNSLYVCHDYEEDASGKTIDPFKPPPDAVRVRARKAFDKKLLTNPNFHAQNVYAIVMRTLARFEQALGRRVAWGFDGHQLHVVPHAFVEANAFYSKEDRALMFGHFKGADGRHVFTCLSHDIVVHEATHAILDGLRIGFMRDSGPDQAAFHEGFADVVSLLSVFSLKEIVDFALTAGGKLKVTSRQGLRLLDGKTILAQSLADSILFGIGKEFGQQLEGLRANALRRSIQLAPSLQYLNDPEYEEPHNRGEIFAAAMLRSMLELWLVRLRQLGTFGANLFNLDAVIEEGAKVADQLLTMAIRALDYCPPLDLEFGDFLAALLTVDAEVVPDDDRYDYRKVIRETFASYGIEPPEGRTDSDGCWLPFTQHDRILYHKTNSDSMLRDREEVFRFIWENRAVLGIDDRAYAQVLSVRPSLRFGPDGFLLRESVCEYTLRANIFGSELGTVCNMVRPDDIKTTDSFTVYGAGTLIFDQYGRVKYHIQRPLNDAAWQAKRIEYLRRYGMTGARDESGNQFAEFHRLRAMRSVEPRDGVRARRE
jgi:hypothetical protein